MCMRMERETGFEPATPSLEGWRSTAELFPHASRPTSPLRGSLVGRGGFEPPKAFASRFTVCPLWPLGYLPESWLMGFLWRWREDLNPRPTAYKAVALPLSYASSRKTSLWVHRPDKSRAFSDTRPCFVVDTAPRCRTTS